MIIVQKTQGHQEEVWSVIKEFITTRPVLAEAGEDARSTIIQEPSIYSWKMWIHAIHTGASANFIVALANEDTHFAEAVVLEGVQWSIESIMETAAGCICDLFSDLNYREKRSIVMDIGKSAHKILNVLNSGVMEVYDIEHLSVTMKIDPYQELLDVDWIEDRIMT
ncbi:hypothetical protein [Paenibacillus ihuae]|uniref:hypothetical protein n=1 Tax=Paenibacillus ihuae TaxID=1232431 RepID=UPI0006D589B1|nr:hypothetical protein [Paenibacillus ihuae]